jgi:hypothetical protein
MRVGDVCRKGQTKIQPFYPLIVLFRHCFDEIIYLPLQNKTAALTRPALKLLGQKWLKTVGCFLKEL